MLQWYNEKCITRLNDRIIFFCFRIETINLVDRFWCSFHCYSSIFIYHKQTNNLRNLWMKITNQKRFFFWIDWRLWIWISMTWAMRIVTQSFSTKPAQYSYFFFSFHWEIIEKWQVQCQRLQHNRIFIFFNATEEFCQTFFFKPNHLFFYQNGLKSTCFFFKY